MIVIINESDVQRKKEEGKKNRMGYLFRRLYRIGHHLFLELGAETGHEDLRGRRDLRRVLKLELQGVKTESVEV